MSPDDVRESAEDRNSGLDRAGEPSGNSSVSALVFRGATGGILMGLANLVPGISGGTMLLATGVYPRFVSAVAEISTLKLRSSSILILASILGSALLAVLMLAGVVKDVVVSQMWLAYSLFVGLTLGGVPVLWRMIGRRTGAMWIGSVCGFLMMALLALVQQLRAGGLEGSEGSTVWLFIAGVGAAGAMVLPGISGGYVFLVLGQYVPVLGAIEAVRTAIASFELHSAFQPILQVLLPCALGILVGIIVVSNAIRFFLERYRNGTLGVLVGLLVGALVGLWPFRRPVRPAVGEVFGEEILTEATAAALPVESWPIETFAPSVGQVFVALSLVGLGFVITTIVAWLGRRLEVSRGAMSARSKR